MHDPRRISLPEPEFEFWGIWIALFAATSLLVMSFEIVGSTYITGASRYMLDCPLGEFFSDEGGARHRNTTTSLAFM